jgi:hypothetical protein
MVIEELETLWDSKGGPINPHYHSVGDTAGILDMNLAGDAARLVVGLISRFAQVPGDSLADIWITEGSAELDWPGRRVGLPPVAGDSLQVELRALNVGAGMEQAESYDFEVWKGTRHNGPLMYMRRETLRVGRGEYTSIDFSWETDKDTYGDITYTFVLLPVDEDLESDLTNNMASTELGIMPVSALLRDIHVTPNPVSFGEEGPKLRFEILHPEGDFNAIMDVWVFDILGSMVGHASFESTPLVHDFGPGDNAIDLSRVVSRQIAPGLYICRTRLELLGEPGTFDAKFKFAVDR